MADFHAALEIIEDIFFNSHQLMEFIRHE